MALKKLLAALSTVACASAMAQPVPLGTVTNVQGVATATTGTTGVAVTPGTVITNGMRIVTTSSGNVTMRMNSGCVVNVSGNAGVTVLQSMSCQELQAAVRPVGVTTTAGPAFGPNPVLFNGIIAAGGIGVLGAGVREVTRDDRENVSPN